jgi:D-serine deaminase-like pyridoxal phosphate-dependent protein
MNDAANSNIVLKSQIETPALVIDLDAMEYNLAMMAKRMKEYSVNLRPHFKTHKTPLLAHKQLEAGAIGITCAKLEEAEVLVSAGVKSILIANQVVDPVKISRLAGLARHAQIIATVDAAENVDQLSEAAVKAGSTINIVIEVEVGMKRCGIAAGEPALMLARYITQRPGLHFAGLHGYEGHTVFIADYEERKQAAHKAMSILVGTAELIRSNGLAVEIVTGGGTGTFDITGQYPGVTEIQAGSYIFNDGKYKGVGAPFRNALTLLATVISVPTDTRAITDAGMKALTIEFGMAEVLSHQGVRLTAESEEHGILEVDPAKCRLKAGEKIELIPSHGCTTINLHERYYACRGDRLEAVWQIAGRGKFR